MEVTIEVPEHIAHRLQEQWRQNIPRHVLESVVLEWFRERILTTEELRQLLVLQRDFGQYVILSDQRE